MRERHFLLAAAGAGFAAAIWYMDPLLLLVFVGLLLFILLVVATAACVFLLTTLRTGRNRRPALIVLAIVATLGFSAVRAIPVNRAIQQRALNAALAYPPRIAPLLEKYHQTHDSYPAKLDLIQNKPRVPRLLRTSYGYRSDGHTYRFVLPELGGMMNTWTYESATKRWHHDT